MNKVISIFLSLSLIGSGNSLQAASFARHTASTADVVAERMNRADSIDEMIDDVFLAAPKEEREDLKKKLKGQEIRRAPKLKSDGAKLEFIDKQNSAPTYTVRLKDGKVYLGVRQIPELQGSLSEQYDRLVRFVGGSKQAHNIYDLFLPRADAALKILLVGAVAIVLLASHYITSLDAVTDELRNAVTEAGIPGGVILDCLDSSRDRLEFELKGKLPGRGDLHIERMRDVSEGKDSKTVTIAGQELESQEAKVFEKIIERAQLVCEKGLSDEFNKASGRSGGARRNQAQ